MAAWHPALAVSMAALCLAACTPLPRHDAPATAEKPAAEPAGQTAEAIVPQPEQTRPEAFAVAPVVGSVVEPVAGSVAAPAVAPAVAPTVTPAVAAPARQAVVQAPPRPAALASPAEQLRAKEARAKEQQIQEQQIQEQQAKEQQAKEQQARQAQAEAQEKAVRAEARRRTAQAELASAKTRADNAERALKVLSAVSARHAPDSAANGDFWSYCWYEVLANGGKTTHAFVTNLINQRIWETPFPVDSPAALAELNAYDGPNTPFRVTKRFEKVMQASGLLPRHTAYVAKCRTYVNLRAAYAFYDAWGGQYGVFKPTYVVWEGLEDEHLLGSMGLPTAEDAARIEREGQEARERLKAAQAALAELQ